MKSPQVQRDQIQASAIFGSYGLQRYLLGGQLKRDKVTANIQFAHHTSDGYREQTALRRNAFNADVRMRTGTAGTLSATLLISDLYYETPGGLNLAQYEAEPSQARPPSASLGAVEAKAAVTNKTSFGGLVYDVDLSNKWSASAGVYGAFSDFRNIQYLRNR